MSPGNIAWQLAVSIVGNSGSPYCVSISETGEIIGVQVTGKVRLCRDDVHA